MALIAMIIGRVLCLSSFKVLILPIPRSITRMVESFYRRPNPRTLTHSHNYQFERSSGSVNESVNGSASGSVNGSVNDQATREFVLNRESLEMLMGMGFSREESENALRNHNNNANDAANELFGQ